MLIKTIIYKITGKSYFVLHRIEQEADQILGRKIKEEDLSVTKFKKLIEWRVEEKNC